MMTVMCPNCQHRFPAPGCCNPTMRQEESNRLMAPQTAERMDFYSGGGILVPRGFTSENSCFINAPTIVHGPTIIQTGNQNCLTAPSFRVGHGYPVNDEPPSSPSSMANHVKLSQMGYDDQQDVPDLLPPSACHITTNCDHKGGSVTITTPRNHSGGCVIKCIDSGVLFQSPVQMRPHLTGGGFVLQNRLSTEFMEETEPIMNEEELRNLPSPKLVENECTFPCRECGLSPPSGCQELPGTRRINENQTSRTSSRFNCHSHSNISVQTNNVERVNPDLQIQVNATVQLPSNLGQCTVNITATTNTVRNTYGYYNIRNLNNLNGGGLIETEPHSPIDDSFIERNDENPSTPVSWLMPCPWTFNTHMMEKDVSYLGEVKKLLQTTGWYHEGMTWQESEKLLKDSPVGSWLMRDSSDSRYSFAVSVQTKRGPTSVRVHFLQGRFRLDAEPRLALAMPLFRCPIKMIEYYVDYSTRMDDQKNQVWIDYSGEIYSHIYMTKPFLKEVTSLSHLARLKVNAYNLPKNHLPVIIRKYLAEYPYSI
ncbi:uncharacterized protein LOC122504988 [Leptopilina heterotoma]|uniref:uncharacterized protein LOC122504988 n=1 Tax=Leptopilina heterotoma TaxID=63436 RepID=UPI001CA84DEA|nr:uncharacterized protein LOC122504988 [Leptopilina heterotoma]XP_043472314.1 uncharacterized protein LOC122504988 [Leptopilina heterotoma]